MKRFLLCALSTLTLLTTAHQAQASYAQTLFSYLNGKSAAICAAVAATAGGAYAWYRWSNYKKAQAKIELAKEEGARFTDTSVAGFKGLNNWALSAQNDSVAKIQQLNKQLTQIGLPPLHQLNLQNRTFTQEQLGQLAHFITKLDLQTFAQDLANFDDALVELNKGIIEFEALVNMKNPHDVYCKRVKQLKNNLELLKKWQAIFTKNAAFFKLFYLEKEFQQKYEDVIVQHATNDPMNASWMINAQFINGLKKLNINPVYPYNALLVQLINDAGQLKLSNDDNDTVWAYTKAGQLYEQLNGIITKLKKEPAYLAETKKAQAL